MESEVRRKNTGREPTTEQEQGTKVRFTEEEKEAQEVREWHKKNKSAREAHAEEWREREKKRHEEVESERDQVVPTSRPPTQETKLGRS